MVQNKGFWVGLSSVVFFGFGLGVLTFQILKKTKVGDRNGDSER